MTRLIALLGVAGISFSAIFVALAGTSPSTSAFLRMLYALPALALITMFQRNRTRPGRRALRLAVSAGVVFALNITVWHYNIDLIGTGLSTVMGNAQIVFIGLIAWLLFSERPTRAALTLIPVMLGSILLISGVLEEPGLGEAPVLGAVLGVLTAALNAAWLLLFREATRSTRNTPAVLLVLTGVAVVVTLAASVIDPGFTLQLPAISHVWLIALALTSQVAGWLLITPALNSLPALEVSVLMLVQPTLTLLWGYLVLGEVHSPLQWLGVGILLACVAVLNRVGSIAPAQGPAALAQD